ncbi:MAG: hypothetical protein J1F12_05880 [Muribaculaceae bacterium]|nr:hypothetical protein [Muribaculaceae bacterium]
MRKSNLLLGTCLLALCFCLPSCSKDEDDVKEKGLVGSWKGYFIDDQAILTFNSDGSVEIEWDWDIDDYEEYSICKYSVDGSTLRIEFQNDETYGNDYTVGTYSISGSTLNYSYTYYESDGESEKLNNSFTKL